MTAHCAVYMSPQNRRRKISRMCLCATRAEDLLARSVKRRWIPVALLVPLALGEAIVMFTCDGELGQMTASIAVDLAKLPAGVRGEVRWSWSRPDRVRIGTSRCIYMSNGSDADAYPQGFAQFLWKSSTKTLAFAPDRRGCLQHVTVS